MTYEACLFCGEAQKLETVVKRMTPRDGNAKIGAYVRCRTCGARGPVAKTDSEYMAGEYPTGPEYDKLAHRAMVLWNRDAGYDDLPLFQFAEESRRKKR